MKPPFVLVVVGPTATGKSDLSIEAALQFGGEIISADSMQLYKGMDTGTAKIPENERKGIPHHLLDVSSPDRPLSVSDYQKLALRATDDILARGKLPILCGGSGLHVNSVTFELNMNDAPGPDPEFRERMRDVSSEELHMQLQTEDPAAADRVHPNNRPRVLRALEIARSGGAGHSYNFRMPSVRYQFCIIGLNGAREKLYERMDTRVNQMMEHNLLNEVITLHAAYPNARVLNQAIGYKELIAYIDGKNGTLEEAVYLIKRNTRRFAKRQLTWFRRDPRIQWFDVADATSALKYIRSSMEGE